MKRYGRNKRRAARERIAHLEDRLLQESITRLYILDNDGLPNLEDFIFVKDYTLTERGGINDLIRFSLSLIIWPKAQGAAEKIYEIAQRNKPMQFKGRKYILTGSSNSLHTIDSPSGRQRRPGNEMTLELEAIT